MRTTQGKFFSIVGKLLVVQFILGSYTKSLGGITATLIVLLWGIVEMFTLETAPNPDIHELFVAILLADIIELVTYLYIVNNNTSYYFFDTCLFSDNDILLPVMAIALVVKVLFIILARGLAEALWLYSVLSILIECVSALEIYPSVEIRFVIFEVLTLLIAFYSKKSTE